LIEKPIDALLESHFDAAAAGSNGGNSFFVQDSGVKLQPQGAVARFQFNARTPRYKDAKMVEPSPEHDLLASQIVDAALAVHMALGPGLLEPVYKQCLVYELETRGIPFQRQVALPVCYRDRRIEAGYRIDLIVGGLVVVEIKAIEKMLPVHEAQLMTYLKLSGHRLGLLINFNVALIRFGIKRRVNTT
jgi:GxxExxY protein